MIKTSFCDSFFIFILFQANPEIKTVNRIFLADNFQISAAFELIVINQFGAAVENLNFSSSATIGIINKQVADLTGKKIQHLIPQGFKRIFHNYCKKSLNNCTSLKKNRFLRCAYKNGIAECSLFQGHLAKSIQAVKDENVSLLSRFSPHGNTSKIYAHKWIFSISISK